MAKPMPDPTATAQKWAQALGAAGTAYTNGVQAVTQAPGQLAAQASDRYLSGVQANVGKFKTNVGAVDLGTWQNAAVTKGAPRLASGATAAQGKMANVLTQLFPFMNQLRSSLPARGDLEANIQRSAAFQRGMAAFQKR